MKTLRAHRILTGIVQVPTVFALVYVDSVQKMLFFCAFEAGICITYINNPDNDLVQRMGILGKIIGMENYRREMPHRFGMYRLQWKKHGWRMFLGSHMPVTGTLVRLLPILVPLSMLGFFVGWSTIFSVLLFVYLGTIWSDLWHIVADYVDSRVKKEVRNVVNG